MRSLLLHCIDITHHCDSTRKRAGMLRPARGSRGWRKVRLKRRLSPSWTGCSHRLNRRVACCGASASRRRLNRRGAFSLAD